MLAISLGKDPSSQEEQEEQEEQPPAPFATDRTDRPTYVAQGRGVTDPQTLADFGEVPPGEAITEIPEDVLRMFERRAER